VDTLITIPNQKLLDIADENLAMRDAFSLADEVLLNAVRGISDLITVHGLINLDFADVRTIMSGMGLALMGAGSASGENRAALAAHNAIASPLLDDVAIDGARGILINITGGDNLTLHEVNEASTLIQGQASDEANIIFGAVINKQLKDEIRITVIATGFDRCNEKIEPDYDKIAYLNPHQIEDEETPTYLRTSLRSNGREDSVTKKGQGTLPLIDEDPTYEIPAFMRKQMD